MIGNNNSAALSIYDAFIFVIVSSIAASLFLLSGYYSYNWMNDAERVRAQEVCNIAVAIIPEMEIKNPEVIENGRVLRLAEKATIGEVLAMIGESPSRNYTPSLGKINKTIRVVVPAEYNYMFRAINMSDGRMLVVLGISPPQDAYYASNDLSTSSGKIRVELAIW